MKLGFYFENSGLPYMDMSRPDLGNPGIGGTQYCFLLLLFYLKRYKPEWEICVYYIQEEVFPFGILQKKVNGYEQLLYEAERDSCNYLIIKATDDNGLKQAICNCKQKIIFWGHNYYLSSFADFVASCDNVAANVFVGKQQYDRYIDHDIITKSRFIFNMLCDPFSEVSRDLSSETVVYMGALIPSKGFHLLARIWKDILRECPDAKLKVIGSGKLYTRNTSLGRYGIAQKSYEDIFMPYLTEKNGDILESVEFLGVLGEEKYEIFKTASVGVVNPSGRTETFGMGVIEMAFCELPVVTVNKNGYPDTVINNKTGILGDDLDSIKKGIIRLLKEPDLNRKMGEEAKRYACKYDPEIITSNWIDLFESLRDNQKKEFIFSGISKPYYNNIKWLRLINRYLRFNLGLRFFPSILDFESLAHRIISKLKSKH